MTKTEIKNLTLGADPELILSQDGELVRADECLHNTEEFGCDGNSSVAELRPKPATTPIGLTEYIGALISWGHEAFPELSMHAGAMSFGYPIGGHIHLGTHATPARLANLDAMTEALENLLYSQADIQRRRDSDYGRVGEFRRKSYGIEYRTPVSWLIAPTVTLVTITLAKLAIVNEDINLKSMLVELGDKKFLLSIKDALEVPEDCVEGLGYIQEVLDTKFDDDLVKNWLEE